MSNYRSTAEFVDQVELAAPFDKRPTTARAEDDGLSDIDAVVEKGESFVNAGSVVAFASSLSGETKRDVLESTLFAQFAANAAAERMVDFRTWYAKYQTVMGALGWSISSFAPVKQTFRREQVEVAEAALDILTAALGGTALKVLETAIASLRKMKDDEGVIQLFDRSSAVDTVANFQLGQAVADGAGNVDMAMGSFYFQSDQSKRRFLFFRWNSRRINLLADAQIITLNAALYDAHRTKVRERLKDTVDAFIKEVPLAVSPRATDTAPMSLSARRATRPNLRGW